MANRQCVKCGDAYQLGHKKPGLITECWECGKDSEVTVYRAEQGDSIGDEIAYDFTLTMKRHDEEAILRPFYLQIKNGTKS